MKFYAYGIYRCKVQQTHKLFKPNKRDYYTHFDLQLCKELNIKVEMIEDNQANCLLYAKDKISGAKMFDKFKEYMYPLKERGLPVKPLISSLWGKLCSKVHKRYTVNESEEIDINKDETIERIYEVNGVEHVKTFNKNNIFKYNYARVGPFLTAYCRLQFARTCMPHIDNIVRINTDSMLTKTDISKHINISKALGDFKLDGKGNCKVINSMQVDWN